MQNYETWCSGLAELQKAVKDAAGAAVRLQKAIAKNVETGNLPEAKKALAQLKEDISLLQKRTEALGSEMEAFDMHVYFVSGDFTRQLLASCEEKKVDVKGEMGIYEMFPYKVRILGDDEHAGEVWMDRKKVNSCRPAYVAETIRAGQEKLYNTPFKAQSIMGELAEAYEVSCLKAGVRPGTSQMLDKIYKNMVPTARARKEYDKQAFAFDLARLYEEGPESWKTKDGACYTFGTSRNGSSGIRVLSRSGAESFISTMSRMKTGEE